MNEFDQKFFHRILMESKRTNSRNVVITHDVAKMLNATADDATVKRITEDSVRRLEAAGFIQVHGDKITVV